MKKNNLLRFVAANVCLLLLSSACGLEQDIFSVSCSLTEIPPVSPISAIRGIDPVPTGFDSVNTSTCTFNMSITSITVELVRDGQTAFRQEIIFDSPTDEITFPLPVGVVATTPANLDPGPYQRVIETMGTDEETIEEVSSYVKVDKTIWIFDAPESPNTMALEALVEKIGVPIGASNLVTYGRAEWSDTSLGCPELGMMYAQVITPGFKLVFKYEGILYEYHTNQNGSSVMFCNPNDSQ